MKCDKCGFKTTVKTTFKSHTNIHLGKRFECKLCNFKSVYKSSLASHIKIHDKIKYNCSFCKYKSNTENKTQLHMHRSHYKRYTQRLGLEITQLKKKLGINVI